MEKLKDLSYSILGLLVFAGILFVLALLIGGGLRLATAILPWIQIASAIVLVFDIVILLPLSFFKKTRTFSAVAFMISSYIYGAELWLRSLLLTYILWGGFWTFIGLMLAGVGVLPMALLATLFSGSWLIFGGLILGSVMTYGSRSYALYLANKVDEETANDFLTENKKSKTKPVYFIGPILLVLALIFFGFYSKYQSEKKIGKVTYDPIPTIEGSDEYYQYEKSFLTYKSDVGFSFQYPPHMFVENKFEPNELFIWPKSILESKGDPYGGIHIEMSKNDSGITALDWLKNQSKIDLSEGYNIIDIDGQEAVDMDGGTWVVVNTPDNKYRIVISLLWDKSGNQSMTEEGIIISSLKFSK